MTLYLFSEQLSLLILIKWFQKLFKLFYNIWVVDGPLCVDARKGHHLYLEKVVSQMKFAKKTHNCNGKPVLNTIMALVYYSPQRTEAIAR